MAQSAHDIAAEIHANALVIDGHADTPQRFLDESWQFTDPLDGGMLSLASARAGGLSAEFFALWAEPSQWKHRYAERTLALLEAVLDQTRRHAADLQLCLSADDIEAAHRARKFAVLLGIEGGHSIENSLDRLRQYFHLGVRYMTLTWSNTNEWADSSGDLNNPAIPHHHGLAPFGKEVIREMNRLGMIVDVSHVSDQTLSDVLEISTAPIIASHSSARALTDAPRNLSDGWLREIAANQGVVMVNFFPAFIDEKWRSAWNDQQAERHHAHAALDAEYSAKSLPVPFHAANRIDRAFAARLPRAPLASLIDHIDHVAKVAGIRHVGIGTDFDGMPSLPEGIDSAADLPRVTAALIDRGYTAEDLHLLLGQNLLRVFRAVQTVAAKSK
jgi:membrane dipeptidase